MDEAKANPAIREPTAMSVATASALDGLHLRVVLCKSWAADGFVFYTNYLSRKGLDLKQNPNAAAVFYWDPLFRQVKISGPVHKTSRLDSEAYWSSRPRESQLSQYISRQSQTVASRDELESAWQKAELEWRDKAILCPEHWGGYTLTPNEIEFWTGRPNRLHDRFIFEKTGKSWTYRRLAP